MNALPTPPASIRRRGQRGLTLVELMVALAIGLVITLASVAALLMARQGYSSADDASQLRENARFAADLLQRIGVQAGFEDIAGGFDSTRPGEAALPSIQGFDNAVMPPDALPSTLAGDSRGGACGGVADTSCANGSDVLVVRYWGVSGLDGNPDGSMINCAGAAEGERLERAFSIFHVARSASGEPVLACTYCKAGTDCTAAADWMRAPIAQGVEGFQVLYGVDNVTPNTAPPAGDAGTDTVADRYLRASQLVVPGNAEATRDNWRRVRSLRIGLLFRGPTPQAVDRAATARTYNVLDGTDDRAASAPVYSDAADTGARLGVPADGRVRQGMVFTVHLRNTQGH